MSSPERLNVLLTRARDALIVLGNRKTFLANRKNAAVWKQFFEILQRNGQIYDGLPITCENHPETLSTLKASELDFCYNGGGCGMDCGVQLSCGHFCIQKCHSLVKCSRIVHELKPQDQVPFGYENRWTQSTAEPLHTCGICDAAAQRKTTPIREMKAEAVNGRNKARFAYPRKREDYSRKLDPERRNFRQRVHDQESDVALYHKKRTSDDR